MSDLLSRIDAMKATERRAAAISAYDDACAHPDCVDWQTIAHALRRALPNVRKVTAAEIADDIPGSNGFAPWHIGKRRPNGGSGKDFGSVRAEITFADGRTVRAYALTYKGSAPDIAGACRAACDLWRYKTQPAGYEWRATVPEIVRVCIPETGAEYDPAHASAYTAEKRAAEPEKVPSLYEIRTAMRDRLAWFTAENADMRDFIHDGGQARLETVWPPISEEIAAEPEPTSEAMPEPVTAAEIARPAPRPLPALARKLLSSAMGGAMPAPDVKPWPVIARRPVALPAFAIAA